MDQESHCIDFVLFHCIWGLLDLERENECPKLALKAYLDCVARLFLAVDQEGEA